MRMLPPSSKVKDYLKYSTPKCQTLIRPVSAGGALKGLHKKAAEKIHLDVLHPDFRIRRRSLSIERNSLSLNVPIFTSHSQHELGYLQRSMASSRGSSAILSPAGKWWKYKISVYYHVRKISRCWLSCQVNLNDIFTDMTGLSSPNNRRTLIGCSFAENDNNKKTNNAGKKKGLEKEDLSTQ